MKRSDLYQAAHNIRPDPDLKIRLAAKVAQKPQSSVWPRRIGVFTATCILSVTVLAGFRVLYSRGSPIPPEGSSTVLPRGAGAPQQTAALPQMTKEAQATQEQRADTHVSVSHIVITPQWPLGSYDESVVEKPFGALADAADGTVNFHDGIDIAASEGASVCAFAGGVVKEIGFDGEYGNYVRIDHGAVGIWDTGAESSTVHDGSYCVTFYAQLSGFAEGLEEGAYVEAGDVIGYAGATGSATEPHLHFGVFTQTPQTPEETPRNPKRFFTEPKLIIRVTKPDKE